MNTDKSDEVEGKNENNKPTNTINYIIDYIRTAILKGTWKQGDKMTPEAKLAKELNVSRASVHCAIQQLVALGILESVQGRGTFVKSAPVRKQKQKQNDLISKFFDVPTLRKTLEFRAVMESGICQAIAPYIQDNVLDLMELCIDRMVANINNPKKLALYDMMFHCYIASATQNEICVQSVERSIRIIRAEIRVQKPDTGVMVAIDAHKKVLECLRRRDGDAARIAMIEHFGAEKSGVFSEYAIDSQNIFNQML